MWTYARIRRGVRNRFVRKVAIPLGRMWLRRALLRTAPIAVADAGDVEVHLLCGARGAYDAVASLKSFLRFASPGVFPLVIHDDGTLDADACALFERHLPGVRIIRRADADREILGELDRAGLPRCRALRASPFVLAMKLFDIPYYAGGRRVLLLDSDILFFERPAELLAAMAAPDASFRERFNADLSEGWYSYDAAAIRAHVGVELVPRYNSGLTCSVRDESSWALYERCLELPMLEHRGWWQEQTLMAVEASRRGAQPLASRYDVAGRLSRAARGVVTEHYCGDMRVWFYPHFCVRVAPEL